MGDYNYQGEEGTSSAVDEKLFQLLNRLQQLNQSELSMVAREDFKEELNQIAHNLEETRDQIKNLNEVSPRTRQLLDQIRSLIHQYNTHFIQQSYQSLLSASSRLGNIPL